MKKLSHSILGDEAHLLHLLEKSFTLLARNRLKTFAFVDFVDELLSLGGQRFHVVLGNQLFLTHLDDFDQFTVDVQDLWHELLVLPHPGIENLGHWFDRKGLTYLMDADATVLAEGLGALKSHLAFGIWTDLDYPVARTTKDLGVGHHETVEHGLQFFIIDDAFDLNLHLDLI